MNSKDFFGALIIGTSIGVVAGILLAPAKGNDTLKKVSNVLKDKFNQYKGEAENAANKLEADGKNIIDKGTSYAKNYLQDGEEKLDGLKSKFNTVNNS